MLCVRVVPRTRPRPGGDIPGVKVDARSERWREHRKKVRAEIVDAAFRAIDMHGPEVSVREIAEEAGTAKPKIYRHFTDKSDLFQAIGERLARHAVGRDLPGDQPDHRFRPATVIRRSIEQYVYLVDEHPNVVRFVLQGRFPEQAEATMRAVNEGREITLAMAELFNNELREMELDRDATRTGRVRHLRHRGLGHRLVAGPRPRQPAADGARQVHRAPDHHHDGRHHRHHRLAGHPDRSRSAHPQGGAARARRRDGRDSTAEQAGSHSRWECDSSARDEVALRRFGSPAEQREHRAECRPRRRRRSPRCAVRP